MRKKSDQLGRNSLITDKQAAIYLSISENPPCRLVGRGPGAPAPTAADAAWPTRSGRSRSRASASAQRRDPVFASGEQPAGIEPYRERRARPVKDRARSHRTTAAAPGAPEAPIAQPPATIVAAVRAGEASVPSQPLQVVQDSPHRCGTRPGTRPRTSDSACQH